MNHVDHPHTTPSRPGAAQPSAHGPAPAPFGAPPLSLVAPPGGASPHAGAPGSAWHASRYEPPSRWPAPALDHPRGTTVLTLGLLSVLGLHVLGPFAWVMAHRALKEADAAPHPTGNRSHLVWGRALGICATWLMFTFVAILALLILIPE